MSAHNFSLKTGSKNLWIKRGLAAAILAGFAWLVITAVTTVDDENLEPTLVKAPTLIKQRPETPGGMKIDHQDKQLFDLLESENSSDAVADAVIAKAQATKEKDEALAKQAVEKKQLAAKAEIKKTVVKVAPVVKKAEPVKAVVKTVETKKAAPVAAKKETKVSAAKTTTGWAVQLGSFRKTTDAKRAVSVYTKKVGNILVGLNSYIKKVDLGTKGVVYRVYFTGLKDGAHAKQICSQLKAQKQACLRAKI